MLGVPSCPEPPGKPGGGTGAELGRCQGGTLTLLQRRQQLFKGRRHAADLVRIGARVRVRVRVRVGLGLGKPPTTTAEEAEPGRARAAEASRLRLDDWVRSPTW